MISYQDIQDSYCLIAGPCVLEEESLMLEIAFQLRDICQKNNIKYIFKASFCKANRSSINSYTGPGLMKGLKQLANIKEKLKVPILTDIHLPNQAQAIAEVADIIQIPAFLARQTDLLLSAGDTDKIINIKKGQFMSPEDMVRAADKIKSTGNQKIMLTERGTFFGYNNLVVDYRSLMSMQQTQFPVVFDATHSLQKPSAVGEVSGGQPELVKQMSMAALATGAVKTLFVETHPDPLQAGSDGLSMLPLAQMRDLVMSMGKMLCFVNEQIYS